MFFYYTEGGKLRPYFRTYWDKVFFNTVIISLLIDIVIYGVSKITIKWLKSDSNKSKKTVEDIVTNLTPEQALRLLTVYTFAVNSNEDSLTNTLKLRGGNLDFYNDFLPLFYNDENDQNDFSFSTKLALYCWTIGDEARILYISTIAAVSRHKRKMYKLSKLLIAEIMNALLANPVIRRFIVSLFILVLDPSGIFPTVPVEVQLGVGTVVSVSGAQFIKSKYKIPGRIYYTTLVRIFLGIFALQQSVHLTMYTIVTKYGKRFFDCIYIPVPEALKVAIKDASYNHQVDYVTFPPDRGYRVNMEELQRVKTYLRHRDKPELPNQHSEWKVVEIVRNLGEYATERVSQLLEYTVDTDGNVYDKLSEKKVKY